MTVDNGLEKIERWLYTPTSVDRLFGIWPVLAGVTQTQPTYRNSRRVIPYYNLHLILSGTLYWSSDRMPTEAILGPGDVFCLFPEIAHQYRAMPTDPPRMTFLAFDGPGAGDAVDLLGLTPETPCLRGLEVNNFLPHLRLLESTFTKRPGGRSLRPLEYLARFLGQLVTATGTEPSDLSAASSLDHARKFMDTHWMEGIRVEDVAGHVGLSRSYFTKAFTREYSISPRDYLWGIRLDHARDLLAKTSLLVTEVAQSVGYADVYSFSHSYRRRFGVSPTTERDRSEPGHHEAASL